MSMNMLPAELVRRILMRVDNDTLVAAVPNVCTQWRAVCQTIRGVTLMLPVDTKAIRVLVRHFPLAGSIVFRTRPGSGRVPSHPNVSSRMLAVVGDACTSITKLVVNDVGGRRRDSVPSWNESLSGDAVHAFVTKHVGLCDIRLDACVFVDDSTLELIAATCGPILEVLSVARCTRVTDRGVCAIVASGDNLTSLCTEACKEVTSLSVVALASGCPRLTAINVSLCPTVAVTALRLLLQQCSGMQCVLVNHCDANVLPFLHIPDKLPYWGGLRRVGMDGYKGCADAMVRALTACGAMTHASFNFCDRLSDKVLVTAFKHWPQLSSLKICATTGPTNACIAPLAASCPLLVELHCWGTDITRVVAFAKLRERCPLFCVERCLTKVYYWD
tara:strand:- start:1858 stop:3021 length:1164 start_codon:yes stop_codon:yes gene_type:complete